MNDLEPKKHILNSVWFFLYKLLPWPLFTFGPQPLASWQNQMHECTLTGTLSLAIAAV